jgi:hypothetical protein
MGVRLSSNVSEIKLVCSILPHRPIPNFAPSWNWRRLTRYQSSAATRERRRAQLGRDALGAHAVLSQGHQGGLCEHHTMSLSDATLKAVQAHDEGATAGEVLNYLSRKFGMAVRPNHLGMALQRHRRAGHLENRNQRWHLPLSG